MEVESEPEPVIDSVPSSSALASISSVPADTGAAAPTSASPQIAPSAASSPATSTRSLKRSAEMMEEDGNEENARDDDQEDKQDTKRKRLSVEPDEKEKDNVPVASTSKPVNDGTNSMKLVDEMGIELTCGCCTELCYNPVIVLPCQHYYCGSCYTLWTRNGGINCPSCRSPVSSIIPSRAIQSLIEVYLRAVPSRERLPREKEQADEIYVAGQSIRVPTPRPRSPEITAPQDNDAYYHPCPHCASPNDFNWSCPVPIISPTVNLTFATLLTAPTFPVGHARCGSCEHIHAPRAPTSSKCDFCFLSFCGLVVPTRCHARRVREQKPLGMDNVMDILGNPEVYDAFGVNAVEFDYLLDHLTSKELNPRYIYSEIVESLASTPDGWRPLLDRGLFPAVTEQERAVPPVPSDAPPQEQPSSQTASPETAVDEAVPPETQPSSDQDQEMIDPTPGTQELNEPPAEVVSETEPIGPTQVQTVDVPTDSGMQVDARPATPIVVPERVPTPTAPEPTLDALPIDVEVEQQQPPVIPVTATEAIEQPTIVSLENTNTSEEVRNDRDEDDNRSDSDRSISPPAPNEAAQTTNDNVEGESNPAVPSSSSAPPPRRGPHLHRICRTCAAEVFMWGARAWWIKERARALDNGELAENMKSRKDCPNLGSCEKEDDNAHAREFNHIPHPPPSASTSGTATTGAQSGEGANTEAAEQPVSDAVNPPPSTDTVPPNETSTDEPVPQEAPSSPERPSRPGSVALERDTMDTDPPATLPVPVPVTEAPTESTIDTHLPLLAVPTGNEEPDAENTSAPDPELESPENSIPSNSSGLGGLVADGLSVDIDASGEYSEKVMPTLDGNGDVHMVIHEENEPPITTSSVRAT